MAAPRYTPEYVESAADVLRSFLIPLLDPDRVSAAGLAHRLAPVRGHHMAKAALESAVLDAELNLHGQSMAARFGATRSRIPAGVVVGVHDSVPALLDTVETHVEQGYRRVKLKIQPGWDLEPVRAVREKFGPSLTLVADANGAYTAGSVRQLAALDPFGLALLEQPLADDDIQGHAQLGLRLETPICLDESITSLRSALDAVERGACRAISIKPGRVGGFLEAIRIHDLCVARGIPATIGGMFETGVGRAGAIALAALPGFTIAGDLSASDRYFRRDVTTPIRLEDGHLRVPTGSGHGAIVDHDFIAEITHHRQMVPLSR
jgi:O-succinylbenzoate synthase